MIKLVEVKKVRDFNVMERRAEAKFIVDEVWINPNPILQIRPDVTMKSHLLKGYLPEGLDERQEFSKINFGSGSTVSSVTVVGAPELIAEKIYNIDVSKQQLLRG